MNTVRLAIVSTHPIQYYAPIFQALAQSQFLRTRIFYTWSQTATAGAVDAGFGRHVTWDIPLLDGYEFEFVTNVARRPGTSHFWGLRNPGLTRAIEKWTADAVLVFGWNSASHLRALQYFKGRVPVFFRGDSTLLDRRSGWRTGLRRALLGWVYRHVDVAIAVGSNNRDYFRWCGVPAERILFAPHAIDTVRFADPDGSQQRRAAQWRTDLGIEPHARTMVFAGKLLQKKDPLLLLEAFQRSDRARHLVFVGDGELQSELRRRAAGRTDVHFLPFQNQSFMPAVYRLGDIFALPSRGPGETWGLAVNEAMATGRPVIVSDKVGGARDLVTPGVNGWVFESGNRDDLVAAVEKAFGCDNETLHGMAEAARRESARWSIEAAAHGIERAVVEFAGISHESAAPLQRRHIRPR